MTTPTRDLALQLAKFLAEQCEPGEVMAALMANMTEADKAALQLAALGMLRSPTTIIRMAYNQVESAKILGMSVSTLSLETKLGKIHRTPIGLYPVHEMFRYLNDEMEGNKEFEG